MPEACYYANGQASPDGATVRNKVAKHGVNRHIQHTLALMCAKKSENIFSK